MKKIICGNWKMNGDEKSLRAMYSALDGVKSEHEIIICPPFTLLNIGAPKNVSVGAQDVSTHSAGAFTGEVSAEMLVATGAKYVIVGHSERRQYHGETNEIVAAKARAAASAGLIPIICVGESANDKDCGDAYAVIETQVRGSVPPKINAIIAYEPVWAIGTGRTPTSDDILQIHSRIAALSSMPILYGGSVNGVNSGEIMGLENVAGVLVGGASLDAEKFIPIINSVN
ncbi:MAG: triose-phosphate isomerase [Rickettsiales bacterium]|jgi:triosephosphate isomerase|nr:triose-phosphate isomerase [Rickettsiales bacterium]